MNQILAYLIAVAAGAGMGWTARVYFQRRDRGRHEDRHVEPPEQTEITVHPPALPAGASLPPPPITALQHSVPAPGAASGGTVAHHPQRADEGDDRVLDVGVAASLPELRTNTPVEFGLRRHGGVWTLQGFSLNGVDAHLGGVPVGSVSLPITKAAHQLHLSQGPRRETLDLSTYINAPDLLGRVALAEHVQNSYPGLFALSADGVVTIVSITAPPSTNKHLAARRDHLEAVVTSYPDLWIGDPDAHSTGMRQDLLRALDYWPSMPPGGALAVAVAGPGPTGVVCGEAGNEFQLVAEDGLLVARHTVHDAVRMVISDTGRTGE